MKLKAKSVYILLMLAVIVAVTGCVGESVPKQNWNYEKGAYPLNNPNDSANVSFYAREDYNGWIENNNDFPVTVKAIDIAIYNGELTKWIKVIEPKNKLDVENILSYRYFITVGCNEKAFVMPSIT